MSQNAILLPKHSHGETFSENMYVFGLHLEESAKKVAKPSKKCTEFAPLTASPFKPLSKATSPK